MAVQRSLVPPADKEYDDIVEAFKNGDRDMAERLLPSIPRPATIMITAVIQFAYLFVEAVSLLHLAAYHGWKDIVTTLVEVHSCTVFVKDRDNHTPLHYAAYQGHLEVVKYLQWLDPLEQNSHRKTPLHYACQMGHLDITKYFIDKLRRNPSHIYKCRHKKTPLTVAHENAWLKITGKVSEKTCTFPCRYVYSSGLYDDDNTLLHLACKNGRLNIAHYLIGELQCKPASYTTTSLGRTLLHYACGYGRLNITQYLIEVTHCNPACCDALRITPLHLACSHGKIEIARYLINDCHCDPSCTATNGDTPLHESCSHGKIEIARYLINDLHCDPSCIVASHHFIMLVDINMPLLQNFFYQLAK